MENLKDSIIYRMGEVVVALRGYCGHGGQHLQMSINEANRFLPSFLKILKRGNCTFDEEKVLRDTKEQINNFFLVEWQCDEDLRMISNNENVKECVDLLHKIDGIITEYFTPPIKAMTTPISSFRSLIQYHDKEKLIQRLHELIDDEKSPAMVGAILLNAWKLKKYLKKCPTQKEFYDEFPNCQYNNWESIRKYTDGESNNALLKADNIVIFEE